MSSPKPEDARRKPKTNAALSSALPGTPNGIALVLLRTPRQRRSVSIAAHLFGQPWVKVHDGIENRSVEAVDLFIDLKALDP